MQEGSSIRSSNYNARPLALQRAKASVQEEVISLLDKHTKGIRNTIRPENGEIFSKYKFYAIPRLGRDVPGFLVIRPEGTYFFNPRRQETYRLRLRLSSEVRESGSILIGTLYYFEKKLVLEDVYRWNGEIVWNTDTFEKRWELLREFFDKHWTQDLYLQKNMEILPTKIQSIGSALNNLDPEMGVDFQPNDPKRKRFFWFAGGVRRPLTKADLALAPAFKPEPRIATKLAKLVAPGRAAVAEAVPEAVAEAVLAAVPAATAVLAAVPKNLKKATFKPHESLPDVYELFDITSKASLGFGSVQEFSTSQQLHLAPPKSQVAIRWNNDFSKYQILSLL